MVPIDSTNSANPPACLHFQYFGFFLRFTTENLNVLLNMLCIKSIHRFLQYFSVTSPMLYHTQNMPSKPILHFHLFA
jgi:hypothetical protein